MTPKDDDTRFDDDELVREGGAFESLDRSPEGVSATGTATEE